ncbi:MAG: Stp1/IreP family PP2C-type Ser/Thr phosphatase [Actinobacteria bacterium]|nr:MAG: Stp1/IreP family PP2C-type Ser/Thr phosphatase [Actinomycetota bacterium]
MRYCSRTDVGRVRDKNEDAVYADGTLFAVADGMGGHRGGEVASSIAIKLLEQNVAASPPGSDLQQVLKEAVLHAHQEIYRQAYESGLTGMGTTLTAAVVDGDKLVVAHIGDSRAYLYRNGRLMQLTHDDSLVAEMVREGQLTKEQAAVHPSRHMLTQALGTGDSVSVSVMTHQLREGDVVLLCTDGLTAMLSDSQIERAMAEEDNPKKLCARLVQEAAAAGGMDNVSVAVLDFKGSAPFESAASMSRGGGRRATRVVALVLIPLALLVAVAFAGLYLYLNSTYYLGFSSDGQVTIFRGVPGSFAGLSYSRVYRKTGVQRDQLWPNSRRRVEENSVVGDLETVLAAVGRLELVAPPLDETPAPEEPGPETPRPELPPGHPPTDSTPTPQQPV